MSKTTTDNNGVQTLYEAPQIEVLEVEVEKGFAQSSGTNSSGVGEDDWQNGGSQGI